MHILIVSAEATRQTKSVASVDGDVTPGTSNMLHQLFLLSHAQARLATWLDHYRSLQLQDGAFMAMLLDSYVVEVGQPWWLHLDIPGTRYIRGSHGTQKSQTLEVVIFQELAQDGTPHMI